MARLLSFLLTLAIATLLSIAYAGPGVLETLDENFVQMSGNPAGESNKAAETYQIIGDEYAIRQAADYLNKLTRNPGFTRALQLQLRGSSGYVSRLAQVYKKCPGQTLVQLPDRPQGTLLRKENCVVQFPANNDPVGFPRSSLRKHNNNHNNQYEAICVCQ